MVLKAHNSTALPKEAQRYLKAIEDEVNACPTLYDHGNETLKTAVINANLHAINAHLNAMPPFRVQLIWLTLKQYQLAIEQQEVSIPEAAYTAIQYNLNSLARLCPSYVMSFDEAVEKVDPTFSSMIGGRDKVKTQKAVLNTFREKLFQEEYQRSVLEMAQAQLSQAKYDISTPLLLTNTINDNSVRKRIFSHCVQPSGRCDLPALRALELQLLIEQRPHEVPHDFIIGLLNGTHQLGEFIDTLMTEESEDALLGNLNVETLMEKFYQEMQLTPADFNANDEDERQYAGSTLVPRGGRYYVANKSVSRDVHTAYNMETTLQDNPAYPTISEDIKLPLNHFFTGRHINSHWGSGFTKTTATGFLKTLVSEITGDSLKILPEKWPQLSKVSAQCQMPLVEQAKQPITDYQKYLQSTSDLRARYLHKREAKQSVLDSLDVFLATRQAEMNRLSSDLAELSCQLQDSLDNEKAEKAKEKHLFPELYKLEMHALSFHDSQQSLTDIDKTTSDLQDIYAVLQDIINGSSFTEEYVPEGYKEDVKKFRVLYIAYHYNLHHTALNTGEKGFLKQFLTEKEVCLPDEQDGNALQLFVERCTEAYQIDATELAAFDPRCYTHRYELLKTINQVEEAQKTLRADMATNAMLFVTKLSELSPQCYEKSVLRLLQDVIQSVINGIKFLTRQSRWTPSLFDNRDTTFKKELHSAIATAKDKPVECSLSRKRSKMLTDEMEVRPEATETEDANFLACGGISC